MKTIINWLYSQNLFEGTERAAFVWSGDVDNGTMLFLVGLLVTGIVIEVVRKLRGYDSFF